MNDDLPMLAEVLGYVGLSYIERRGFEAMRESLLRNRITCLTRPQRKWLDDILARERADAAPREATGADRDCLEK